MHHLILTSPPYAGEVGEIDKRAWGQGTISARHGRATTARTAGTLGTPAARPTSRRWARSTAVLKPGGFMVVMTKNLRAGGALRNLAGDTIGLCQAAGLAYWQHVIALLATIRDGELIPRPSFWQLTQIRRALARGERTHLVCHEDVLVFRKAAAASSSAQAAAAQPRVAA